MVGPPPPPPPEPGTPEFEAAERRRKELEAFAERLGCTVASASLVTSLVRLRDTAEDLRAALAARRESLRGFQEAVTRGEVDTTLDEQATVATRLRWVETILGEDAVEAFAKGGEAFLADLLRRCPHVEWSAPDPSVLRPPPAT
jgi:hypothetical protein